jgi:hypothetical protein
MYNNIQIRVVGTMNNVNLIISHHVRSSLIVSILHVKSWVYCISPYERFSKVIKDAKIRDKYVLWFQFVWDNQGLVMCWSGTRTLQQRFL